MSYQMSNGCVIFANVYDDALLCIRNQSCGVFEVNAE